MTATGISRLAAAGTTLLLLAALAGGCAHDPRPWVRNLRFSGVTKVRPRELREKLLTEQTSWIPLARKHYLAPSTLEQDKHRIEAYYAAHGYFGARVTGSEVKPRARNSVDIRIAVVEGEPTRIGELRVVGVEPLGEAGQRMRREIGLRVGDVFDHERYLDEKARLKAKAQERGWAWAEVEGQATIDRDARRAIITLTLRPSVAVRFGAVSVEGAQAISPRLISRVADVPAGELFQASSLEIAKGRLDSLGVFSSVRVEATPAPGHPEIALVRIVVSEAKLRQLRLGVGFGLEAQRTEVHLKSQLTLRNFFGGLRTLRLRIDPGYVVIPAFWAPQRHGPQVAVEAQLVQPDFPFRRAELKWSIGYDVGIEYGYRFHGPQTQLGFTFPAWRNRLRFGVSVASQFLDFFDAEPGLLSNPKDAGARFGYVDPYGLAWLNQLLTLDLRDRSIDAKRGFFASLALEEGVFFSETPPAVARSEGPGVAGRLLNSFKAPLPVDPYRPVLVSSYQSLLLDVRGYVPIGSRVVVAARVSFGHVFVQPIGKGTGGNSLGSPITRRLYLGGPSSHRGFNYNRLSVQVPSGEANVPLIPIGGDEMILGQLELRVDLFKLFGSWVSAANFLDLGDVAPPDGRVDLRRLHYAVGGGLRYQTVVGTIRLDLAARLNRLKAVEPDATPNPDPNERFTFHISVGEAF